MPPPDPAAGRCGTYRCDEGRAGAAKPLLRRLGFVATNQVDEPSLMSIDEDGVLLCLPWGPDRLRRMEGAVGLPRVRPIGSA